MLFYYPMIRMAFRTWYFYTPSIYQNLSISESRSDLKAKSSRQQISAGPFGQFGQCDCESSTFKVTTYLLESSRVVVHAKRERTYHCFYVSCHRIWTLQARSWSTGKQLRESCIFVLFDPCEISKFQVCHGVPEFIHERLRRCCEVCQMKSCLSCSCNGTSSICCLEASPLILRWTGEMVGAWKNSSTGRWQLFGSGKLLGAKCITWED